MYIYIYNIYIYICIAASKEKKWPAYRPLEPTVPACMNEDPPPSLQPRVMRGRGSRTWVFLTYV